MIKCLIITIIIETLLAIILKVKDKKDIITIILANVITNPFVVTIPIFIYIKYGYRLEIITLITIEILTIIVEGLIYHKTLKYKKIDGFKLSIILNILSYFIGEIINKL